MPGRLVFALLCGWAAALPAAELVPQRLRCAYLDEPLGIDVARPRLSWQLTCAEANQLQSAWQILVASRPDELAADRGDLWDSGKVAGDEGAASVQVRYAGKPLASHQQCFWKVRAWDRGGKVGPWSKPARWSMGVLSADEWRGAWIGYQKPFDQPQGTWAQTAPSPIFRKAFTLPAAVRRATISIAGLGYYELRVNGKRIGDRQLDPAFTRYDKRVLYTTYDVTEALARENVVGVALGNGWYNSHTRCVWDFDKAPWRDEPKLRFLLRAELTDGRTFELPSDATWKAATGPLLLDGIRNGHVYDARRKRPGWDAPGFDDAGWAAAAVVRPPAGALRAQMLPPIRITQTLPSVDVRQTRPGVWLFDFGQNIAGWAKLCTRGPAGTTVTMRYTERVLGDGSLDRTELDKHVKSGPFQTDVYILKGDGQETWEPAFAYHGFRWVEVEGLAAPPTRETLAARVVHTDFERIGEFRCSNPLLNTIQQHTLWSYRGNFHGYPTDCPHREKNGWTGDAHLACEQSLYNWENTAAYRKWIDDLADEQQPDGNLPGIVPTAGWGYKWGNGPAWDSAYVLLPWYLYLYRGDRDVLAAHYEGMKRYVDYMTSRSKNGLVEHGLGDWVPAKTVTPVAVTSSGYYAVDAETVATAARLLGKDDEAKRYGELAQSVRHAFHRTFHRGEGLYANGSQTAQSCALFQDLAPRDIRPLTLRRLAEAVEKADFHLDTGILGAKYLFHSLSAGGRHDLAYRIACQTSPPSYGDWIARGATTLWEDWGDGSSRNHIMFGDISAWFYRWLAGIQADDARPGLRHFYVRPGPVGDLTEVSARTESLYGRIAVDWKKDGGRLSLRVVVPVNTTATVCLPPAATALTIDGRPAASPNHSPAGDSQYGIGSGEHRFEVNWP